MRIGAVGARMPDYNHYRCSTCGEVTGATAWPNYCPVCCERDGSTWGFEGERVE